jgi:hypothetical protein
MELKTGDVILFEGNSVYSFFIRMYNKLVYTYDGYTHAGIISEVSNDYVEVYEALAKGVGKYPYERWWLDLKVKEEKIIILRPKHKLKDVEEHCKKYLGVGYGYFDIFAIVLDFIFGFKLNFSGSKRLICSEKVVRVLYDASNKKINFEEEFKKKFDFITPTDISVSKQLEVVR